MLLTGTVLMTPPISSANFLLIILGIKIYLVYFLITRLLDLAVEAFKAAPEVSGDLRRFDFREVEFRPLAGLGYGRDAVIETAKRAHRRSRGDVARAIAGGNKLRTFRFILVGVFQRAFEPGGERIFQRQARGHSLGKFRQGRQGGHRFAIDGRDDVSRDEAEKFL